MNEVVEMVVHKFPLLVMLAKLLAVVFQKIRFEFVPVKEIIPVINDRFKASASDGFRLFRHDVALKLRSRSFLGWHKYKCSILRGGWSSLFPGHDSPDNNPDRRKHPMFQRRVLNVTVLHSNIVTIIISLYLICCKCP